MYHQLCHGQRWDPNRNCYRMSYLISTLTLGAFDNHDLASAKVQSIIPDVEGNRRVCVNLRLDPQKELMLS